MDDAKIARLVEPGSIEEATLGHVHTSSCVVWLRKMLQLLARCAEMERHTCVVAAGVVWAAPSTDGHGRARSGVVANLGPRLGRGCSFRASGSAACCGVSFCVNCDAKRAYTRPVGILQHFLFTLLGCDIISPAPELEYRGVTRVGISRRYQSWNFEGYRMSSRYQSWNIEALPELEFRAVTRVGIPSRYVS